MKGEGSQTRSARGAKSKGRSDTTKQKREENDAVRRKGENYRYINTHT